MAVIIMRGLPGAGKTRYVAELRKQIVANVCSADDYHMINGEYKFDPAKAREAHDACLRQFLRHIMEIEEALANRWLVHGRNAAAIVVDNTNTSLIEMAPYVRMAQAYGHELTIKYLLCDPCVAIRRNTHDVPANTILTMYNNLVTQTPPRDWNQEVILPE